MGTYVKISDDPTSIDVWWEARWTALDPNRFQWKSFSVEGQGPTHPGGASLVRFMPAHMRGKDVNVLCTVGHSQLFTVARVLVS